MFNDVGVSWNGSLNDLPESLITMYTGLLFYNLMVLEKKKTGVWLVNDTKDIERIMSARFRTDCLRGGINQSVLVISTRE